MPQELEHTIALLERFPAVLAALLHGLPDAWTATNEGEGTWTPYDVVGHLVQGERADWMPRARRILEHGTARAFDPFDREAQRRESAGRSLPELLDELARLRARNLADLRALALTPARLESRGLHPALGEVTLGQLLATWAAHDLTHLHQLARVMAHQYREAVGPWRVYLGVLQCAGHSAAALPARFAGEADAATSPAVTTSPTVGRGS